MSKPPPFLDVKTTVHPDNDGLHSAGTAVQHIVRVRNRKNLGRSLRFGMTSVMADSSDARPTPAHFAAGAVTWEAQFRLARQQQDDRDQPLTFVDPGLQPGETAVDVRIDTSLTHDRIGTDPAVLRDGLAEDFGLVESDSFRVKP